jgi:hypothetical protein
MYLCLSIFSLGTPVSSNNKTDRNDITEIILLKVALNTINQPTLSDTVFFYYNNKHIINRDVHRTGQCVLGNR